MEPVEDQFNRNCSGNSHHVLNYRPKWKVAPTEINAHSYLWDNAQNFEHVVSFIGSCNYPYLKKGRNYL